MTESVVTGEGIAGKPAAEHAHPPRQRILAAARELFHRHGIRAVGVEAIAEAAATNKMTLYRHFGSKDELVAAYLNELASESNARWDGLAEAHRQDPATHLEGWLIHVEEVLAACGGRGCALANAAVELRDTDHPGRRIIESYKAASRERLVALFAANAYAEPDRLADEVFLLFEGARISAQFSASQSGPAARLVSTLRGLLAMHPRAGRRE